MEDGNINEDVDNRKQKFHCLLGMSVQNLLYLNMLDARNKELKNIQPAFSKSYDALKELIAKAGGGTNV